MGDRYQVAFNLAEYVMRRARAWTALGYIPGL